MQGRLVINNALFAIIEEAATDVLTLCDGKVDDELLGSGLTRKELVRQLDRIVQTCANLPADARAALPEIDWGGWAGIGCGLGAGGPMENEAICFAVHSLAPATLMWLRVYRQDAAASRGRAR